MVVMFLPFVWYSFLPIHVPQVAIEIETVSSCVGRKSGLVIIYRSITDILKSIWKTAIPKLWRTTSSGLQTTNESDISACMNISLQMQLKWGS